MRFDRFTFFSANGQGKRLPRTRAKGYRRSPLDRLRIESLESRRMLAGDTILGGEGSSWLVIDELTTSNGAAVGGDFPLPGIGGSILDATLPDTIDSYDGSSLIFVDNIHVAGNLSVSGRTANFSPVTIAGLNAQLQYYFAANSATARTLLTLSNPTATDITVPVNFASNWGSDDATTITGSSSGDSAFGTNDRWLVTDDDTLTGDAANTTVFRGPGSPQVTPSSVSTTVFQSTGTEGALATYSVTIPAGQTRALMFFHQLNLTSAEALADAPVFFDTNPALGSDLLEGLTAEQLAQIVNFDFAGFTGVVNGTAGDDVLVVTATGPDSGSYTLNGGPAVAFSGVPLFNFNGLGGNDTLRIINPAGGLFAPAGGILFNGGGQSGDTLDNLGGSANSGTYVPGPTNADGIITHVGDSVTQVITFTGLAPVNDTVAEATFTITGTAGADTINIVDGPLVGADQTTQVNSGVNNTFERINFANKTEVTVDAGAGVDVVVVNNPLPAVGLAALTVIGGLNADEIQVLATPASVATIIDTDAHPGDRTVIGGTFAAFNTGVGTLANILGAVHVTDAGSIGQLYIDASGDAVADVVTMDSTSVIGAAPAVISYDSGNITTIQLALGSGADSIDVVGAISNQAITIFGNAGDDTLTAEAAGIAAGVTVTFNGGNDTDTVVLNGVAAINETFSITPGAGGRVNVARTAPDGLNLDVGTTETVTINGDSGEDVFNVGSTAGIADVATVNLNGGDDADELNVTASATITFNVNGGAPATSPGDTLNFNAAGQTITADSTSLTATGRQPVNYENIETINVATFSGSIIVNGSGLNDVLVITATGADSGSYQLNGGPSVIFAGVTRFEFNGLAGDDLLQINNPVGSLFAPSLGIFYNGGGGAFVDSLENLGGSATSGSYLPGPTDDAGVIQHVGPVVTQTITFTGLAPATDTVAEATFTVFGTDGANTITVDDGTATGDGLVRISIDAFEPIEFGNKTNVVINAGITAADAGDTININYSDLADGLTTLIVNGGGGNDTINLLSSATAVVTNLNGNAGNDDIVVDGVTLNAALTADGGAGANTLTVLNTTITGSAGNGLTGLNFATADIADSTFSGNADAGAEFATVGVVTLISVTASTNEIGVVVDGATSFDDTDGIYTQNINDGLLLIDIAGNVTLTRTTANDNDANNGGVGDGIHAQDGNDVDTYAIGGDLIINGGNFNNTAAAGLQQNGIFVSAINGSVTLQLFVTASGNVSDGVHIVGNATQIAQFHGGIFSDNGDDGVDLSQFFGAVINHIVTSSNGSDGLEETNVDSTVLMAGSYNDNGDHGINIVDALSVTIHENITASNNGLNGIHIENAAVGVSVVGNLIDAFATLSNNGGSGLFINNPVQQGMVNLANLVMLDNQSGFGADISNVLSIDFTTTTVPVSSTANLIDVVDLYRSTDHQFRHTRGGTTFDPIRYDNTAVLNVNTLAGEDTANVSATRPGTATTVDTGASNDTVNLGATGGAPSDFPNNDLSGIVGALTLNGGGEDAGSRSETVETELYGNVTATVDTGDVLNILDQAGPAGSSYTLTGNTFTRTGIVAVSYADFEEINLQTAAAPGPVNITSTAAAAFTSVTASAGSNAVNISGTGAASILIVETLGGADTVNVSGTGAASVTKVRGGAGNDTFTLAGTGIGAGVQLDGDDGADTFTLSGNAIDSRVRLEGGDHRDVFNIQATIATSGTEVRGGRVSDVINIGLANSISNIQGPVAVFGEGNNVAPATTLSVTAIDMTRSQERLDGDILNINDTATAGGQTYAINNLRVTRTGTAIIDYRTIETLNLDGGNGNNTYNIARTNNGQTFIRGNGGIDTFNVSNTWNMSNAVIDGGAGADTFNITNTASRSITHFLGGGGADLFNVTRTGNQSGVLLSGGIAGDTFEVSGTGTTAALLIEGDAGDDTFAINGTALNSRTEALGRDGNDSFTVGSGTLDNIIGRINLLGGTNTGAPITVRSGGTVNGADQFVESTVVRATGDTVTFDDSADADGDDYLLRQPGNTLPYFFRRTGNAAIEFDAIEQVNVNTGAGDDELLASNIQMTGGAMPFLMDANFGGGADRLRMRGSNGDDNYTVGATDASAVLEPLPSDPVPVRSIIMTTGMECLYMFGGRGNDVLVNNTAIQSTLSGGLCNAAGAGPDRDILVGGDVTDIIYGGPDVDALFGRDASDYLFADHDETDHVCRASDEIIDGGIGDVDNAVALGGGDRVSNIEGVLVEEGAIKGVIEFLQAQLFSANTPLGQQKIAQLLAEARALRCDI